ncbi:MAG: cation:proton antiporter [Spirochaetales bacterium]|nr:cation:proton antiporter [Spirochaetales bacterium]
MFDIASIQNFLASLNIPNLLLVGFMTFTAFYLGKSMKFIRLPSIIGFMLIGVILGPSLFGLLNEPMQKNFSFITEIALAFVAVSIGLELKFSVLKRQGLAMVLIILFESFLAFLLVTGLIYLLTGDLPLSLIFGAIAPASAPAGTVAIIREYRAKGSLTKALYTVVGFDDGLGIIIFGFAAAFAKSIITGGASGSFLQLLSTPLLETFLSLFVGVVMAVIFCFFAKRLEGKRDIFILIFAFILVTLGICSIFHFSLILTNMVLGLVIVNTQRDSLVHRLHDGLSEVMPLLFILFFVLAGANLHVAALPSLGLIGIFYLVGRSVGLMAGAWFGAVVGKAEKKIKKYLGMGILSQAGVAIGLSLIVKHEFSTLGPWGQEIGNIVITTITATCIIFEIIGPIATKFGLEKAGEIPQSKLKSKSKAA